MHLIYVASIYIIVLKTHKLAAGDKRNSNKADRKKPQDFMQTLIPQIGSKSVLRLPLL